MFIGHSSDIGPTMKATIATFVPGMEPDVAWIPASQSNRSYRNRYFSKLGPIIMRMTVAMLPKTQNMKPPPKNPVRGPILVRLVSETPESMTKLGYRNCYFWRFCPIIIEMTIALGATIGVNCKMVQKPMRGTGSGQLTFVKPGSIANQAYRKRYNLPIIGMVIDSSIQNRKLPQSTSIFASKNIVVSKGLNSAIVFMAKTVIR